MSTHKKIDIICIIATLFVIALTILFINGSSFGVLPAMSVEAGDDMFTANDLNADWDTSSATKIVLSDKGSSISGNGAYVYDGNVYIAYAGHYVFTGELTNGSIIIDAEKSDKIWLSLNGVTLHCEDDAAIRVEQADKVFLTLADGTENAISSGAQYNAEIISSGVDGAVYSRDDLTINGTGALTVNTEYHHGIVCNDDLVITGGNITISAVQDGIHANDSVRIHNTAISISAGDDGITASNDDETSFLYMKSGNVVISDCYEGLEAINVTIAGGTVDITATDDGINACGSGADSAIRIAGGDITITNPSGRDADGLDSNGSIYIEGGRVFISVSGSGGNCALDYGEENGGVCAVSGGTVIACGGSAMASGFDGSSTQGFVMYNTDAEADTEVSLKDSLGEEILSEKIPCSFSSVVLSAPELEVGDVCTIAIGEAQEEITIDNVSASSGPNGKSGGDMRSGWKHDGPMDRQDFGDGTDMEPPDKTEVPDKMEMPDNESLPDQQETKEAIGRAFMPDKEQGQGEHFLKRQDGGKNGDRISSSGNSSGIFILLGISVLALLIGLFAAVKVKPLENI